MNDLRTELSADDRTAAAIGARYPGWNVYVNRGNTNLVTFCAVPPGCEITQCSSRNPDELVAGIERYIHRTPAEIDDHVAVLRARLDAMPAHWEPERAFLNRRIEAEGRSLMPAEPE